MTQDIAEHATSAGPCGVVVVDKPAGVTSHDVVNMLRRRFDTKRIGHTGTLDPMATGVLVLCVGAATRIAAYVPDEPKEYVAQILLGVATDTEDTSGTVVAHQDASAIGEACVRASIATFRGSIEQTPPMFSAVKVAGERLYKLARRGIVTERHPRQVVIHDMQMLDFEPGTTARVGARILCSSGTYIRTLAADLGRALGVGGTLASLRRVRVGPFTLADAEPVDTCHRLMPVTDVLRDWPLGTVDTATADHLLRGKAVPREVVTWTRQGTHLPHALLQSPDGTYLWIAESTDDILHPRRLLRCGLSAKPGDCSLNEVRS